VYSTPLNAFLFVPSAGGNAVWLCPGNRAAEGTNQRAAIRACCSVETSRHVPPLLRRWATRGGSLVGLCWPGAVASCAAYGSPPTPCPGRTLHSPSRGSPVRRGPWGAEPSQGKRVSEQTHNVKPVAVSSHRFGAAGLVHNVAA
jgi:hypothetical protein